MVKDMTSGSPMRLILAFAMPLLLGNILQQTYSLIDAAIVGQYLGMNALAGIGASSSVLFMILGFCNGLTGGFGIPIAQAFGAQDYRSVRSYVRHSYLLSVLLSCLLAALCCRFCSDILRLMKTPQQIFPHANVYLYITFATIPFNLGFNLFASILRALGDSRTPFALLLLSTVLNILLDLLFILLCGWGVAGAALATALAQFLCILVFIHIVRHRFPILHAQGERLQFRLRQMGRLLAMGVPMGLQFSITAIGSIMLQSANNALGTVCATAFTTGLRIKMFCMCPFENLGVAMATYCGQNLGASRLHATVAATYLLRIRQGVKSAIILMLLYCAFIVTVLQLFSYDLSLLFVYAYETEILQKSEQFLRFTSMFYPALGLLCILRYSLQGLGYTSLSMFSGVSEMFARIAASLFIVPALGFMGICIGDPLAWISAVCFLVPTFLIVYRRLYRIPAR